MRRKKEEKEQRMDERDYRPQVVCMIPTMPSAHGMTSAVPSAPTCTCMIPIPTMPSAPTMLPMPTIQTTPTCTCSVSSQCTI